MGIMSSRPELLRDIPDVPCTVYDPDIWFPEDERRSNVAMAKALCRSCVDQADCLQGALERDEPAGVWGGMSTPERKELKSRGFLPRVA